MMIGAHFKFGRQLHNHSHKILLSDLQRNRAMLQFI